MFLNNCSHIQPFERARMFDTIYAVFPLRALQGIVVQYSGCNVNGKPRDLVPNNM